MTGAYEFLSREELLRGLPARRTTVLLFAIEGRTARLVDRSRRAMAFGVTERTAEAREQAFLEAVAEGRELPIRPTIQDLERYAPAWAPLVPPDPAMRAALFHALSERYVFTSRIVPALRDALGVADPTVEHAYSQLYGRPLAAAYAGELPWRERLRWRRAAASRSLETLPPVWLAFALTLTEMVGGGVLALPIALAEIGPAAAVVVLVLLGLVNMATLAAAVEAVTRDGEIRYGSAYFGRLARGYLGDAATAVLTPALLVLMLLALIAYFLGFATTLADVTTLPATLWAAALFVAAVLLLRRESLNATVASSLVVGAVNIALIATLAALAFGAVDSANLRHVDVPWMGGRPFEASALTLAFGVVLAAYFGHTSAGNAAKVVLRRDPGGRALLVGNTAAIAVAIALYCLFVVAVNGAVEPSTMASAAGTGLEPLAEQAGAAVHVFGVAFVVLAMGMASVHMALGISNQVREWVPAAAPARPARLQQGTLHRLFGGRAFWISMSPVAATLLLIEWLLASDRSSFASALSFLGTLTIPLVGGIFPMLMLVASRRKGEYVPANAVRLLAHPAVVALVLAVYFGGLLAYGLVIWEAPLERAAALFVAALMIALTVVIVRRGAFTPQAFVELRVEEEHGGRAVVEATVEGQSVDRPATFDFAEGDAFGALRSVTVELPQSRARTLKLRAHRVTAEGDSEPLTGTVEIRSGSERQEFQVDGLALVPVDGGARRVRVSFADHA